MPSGRQVGTVGGAAIGTAIAPGVGTMIGAGLGGMVGGMFDDDEEERGAMPRYSSQYGSRVNNVAYDEANRASQVGAQNADSARQVGRDIGVGANAGIASSIYERDAANRRAGGLYGDAAGMYGRAEGNAADAAAARGDTMAAIGRLRSFYEQGPGPSAAQAQLKQGGDSAMRQSLALARTGGGRSDMRSAVMANAGTRAQTNQQAAQLRAQENADFQNRRLNAMGMEQNALSGVRAGDVGVMGQRLGAGGQMLGAAGQQSQIGLGYGGLGAQYQGLYNQGRLGAEGMAQGASAQGEQMRGNIFDRQLQSDTARYGADKGVQVGMANVAQRDRAADMAMTGTLIGAGVNMMQQQQQTSDIRAKENIRPVSAADLVSRVDALESRAGGGVMPAGQRATMERLIDGTPPGQLTSSQRADMSRAIDGPDLRNAGSYSYDYKNASYGPDNQVGPMAQELEKTDASGAVSTGPDGMKSVDPGRLTMTNTSAIAEQQRRLDRLEALAAIGSEADWQPKGAATQGQRTIRKTEGIEGRRMSPEERRAMLTFGHSGSLRPQDEEYLKNIEADEQRERMGAGNVDLFQQPKVKNPDGSISTVDSSGYHLDGQEVLLPSVTPDGRHLQSEDDIIGEYRKTGRYLGKFPDVASSDAYARQLHEDYAAGKYDRDPRKPRRVK